MLDNVCVTALSFTEYVMSGQRGRINIVTEQRGMYLAEDPRVCGFYNPVRSAMRRAANSTEPEIELKRAVQEANRNGQPRAFEEIADGFLPWLEKLRATGVPVESAQWRTGDLTLRVRPHLGLRKRDGSTFAVLVHTKEVPLTREAANVGLRILQHTVEETLPGATPMILDARRGRSYTMSSRTNLAKLDVLITAEAVGYVTHWRMSA
ncbi:hypothetical protein Lesp02_43570 [Lentzea sp. NBRC 105346]|uniref:hypothetical protein n=1 Tax=Lentzea sp. NBRC 105346 TaxID=3032205 RepID=UPI0024A25D6C|nr:hypothetical protein [Lentzea sp. NBRC 105346]GLZ32169.1 hypothetical protein Lesp02_43570 [Lentzea sp. NBRC 105346]